MEVSDIRVLLELQRCLRLDFKDLGGDLQIHLLLSKCLAETWSVMVGADARYSVWRRGRKTHLEAILQSRALPMTPLAKRRASLKDWKATVADPAIVRQLLEAPDIRYAVVRSIDLSRLCIDFSSSLEITRVMSDAKACTIYRDIDIRENIRLTQLWRELLDSQGWVQKWFQNPLLEMGVVRILCEYLAGPQERKIRVNKAPR